MKYYLDTEFLEGTQKEKFPISLFRKNTPPTIDLISIGIVSEDGREYYAISKDFNLKEAWNRFDWKEHKSIHKEDDGKKLVQKVYWIRENVLKPIFEELYSKSLQDKGNFVKENFFTAYTGFTYGHLKALINYYGKTNKQIADEIVSFTTKAVFKDDENGKYLMGSDLNNKTTKVNLEWDKPEFYAYYADYDWVVFCWLWGKMMDLPKGFPMYCKDLKQILDEKVILLLSTKTFRPSNSFSVVLDWVKRLENYPKQDNAHNALDDARWNKKLYEFLNTL